MASGLAITGFVLGILAFFIGGIPVLGWALVLAAIIVNIVALAKNAQPKWMPVTGLILSIISVVFFIVMVGAIAYFGVLSPSNLIPDSCISDAGFVCPETQNVNGIIQANMVSTMAGVTFDTTTVTSPDCTDVKIEPSVVAANGNFVVSGNCPFGAMSVYGKYQREGSELMQDFTVEARVSSR